MIDPTVSAHYVGDCRKLLALLPDGCIQTVVTSPPYWGLRDYGHDGQIGLEPTPEEYVEELVRVFREIRRVLRDDGTLWLNLGDSYTGARGGAQGVTGQNADRSAAKQRCRERNEDRRVEGLAYKNLIGIPWRVALALQADGWILRSDIIWHKPNPMPSSVLDRVTPAHEYVFLFAKSARYHFDAEAIAEPAVSERPSGNGYKRPENLARMNADGSPRGQDEPWSDVGGTRNARSVWTIATQPYSGAHFATMPPRLAERCVVAGAPPGGVVLDPFFGSGTVGMVAEKHGRKWIGFDLGYEQLAKERTAQRSLPIGGS